MSSSSAARPRSSGKRRMQESNSSDESDEWAPTPVKRSSSRKRSVPLRKPLVPPSEDSPRPSADSLSPTRDSISSSEDSLQRRKQLEKASTRKTTKANQSAKTLPSVYDAVAGRVGAYGFLVDRPGAQPVRPEETLFKHAGAPIRYEEDDPYWQDRYLPNDVHLPSSDLLKAIHAYVSDFYGSELLENTIADFQSLDETALMAIGVLLEEAAHHALERTGDLAAIEAEGE